MSAEYELCIFKTLGRVSEQKKKSIWGRTSPRGAGEIFFFALQHIVKHPYHVCHIWTLYLKKKILPPVLPPLTPLWGGRGKKTLHHHIFPNPPNMSAKYQLSILKTVGVILLQTDSPTDRQTDRKCPLYSRLPVKTLPYRPFRKYSHYIQPLTSLGIAAVL